MTTSQTIVAMRRRTGPSPLERVDSDPDGGDDGQAKKAVGNVA
jgi:hypothetical protein